MVKILISDKISDNAINLLKSDPDFEVHVKTGLKEDELVGMIDDYDALIVRSATKVTRRVIEAGHKLKLIGRAGTGVDNIDVEAATERGIIVMNTPGANTIAAAEHAIAMLLALARKIPQADASMKQGKWDKKSFMGVEIRDKVLGIIGIGRIGSYVAKLAQGLQMKVIAYDPYISEEAAKQMGVRLVSLDELLSESDFISIHSPLTRETKHLLNKEKLLKMKKGALLVNCARGGIVVEKDLYEVLVSGHLGGAALDVFEEEPPQDYSLVKLPNVIATPHIGASTYEAQEIVGLIISQQVFDYFKRGIIRNAVNAPSVRPELIPKIEPYVGLITKLGSFVVQLFDGRVEEFEIEYAGEVVEEGLYSTLTSSALAGVLKPILGNGVNEINAPYIAKQRGIRVIEKKSRDTEGFASLIKIVLRSKDKEASVCGTLIRKNDPRIVMVNGFPVEAEPRGYILYFKNYDRPGVIGRIGTLLGEANINIAGMRLGRFKPGEEAVALLNVDQPVPDELLKKIEELPNIIEVKMLNLD
ncbi:MAG: phosphoglycerate dehydrogenase [Thermosulfidibacteraceae bacterium]|jgi:D-3-phosphoglycerate dehydrogenase